MASHPRRLPSSLVRELTTLTRFCKRGLHLNHFTCEEPQSPAFALKSRMAERNLQKAPMPEPEPVRTLNTWSQTSIVRKIIIVLYKRRHSLRCLMYRPKGADHQSPPSSAPWCPCFAAICLQEINSGAIVLKNIVLKNIRELINILSLQPAPFSFDQRDHEMMVKKEEKIRKVGLDKSRKRSYS